MKLLGPIHLIFFECVSAVSIGGTFNPVLKKKMSLNKTFQGKEGYLIKIGLLKKKIFFFKLYFNHICHIKLEKPKLYLLIMQG